MRALSCPRCHRETMDPLAETCHACGAPLRLAEEPPPAPLTAPVAIDRRAEDAEAIRAHVGDELADVESSVWDLGPLVPTRSEPIVSPPAPRPRPAAASRSRVGPTALPTSAPIAPPTLPPRSSAAPTSIPTAPATAASTPTSTATATPTSTATATAPAAVPRTAPPAIPRPAAAARAAPAPARPPTAAPAPRAVPARAPPDGVLEVHVRRAEPWRRAAAWGVDALPFVAGGAALANRFAREAGAASGLDLLDLVARERVIVLSVAGAAVVALAVYATLAHALAGATLGKRLLRLRVVGPDGERPGLARSATRSALAVASAGALGLGFLLALFTAKGRALHDLLARTWVVDAQP